MDDLGNRESVTVDTGSGPPTDYDYTVESSTNRYTDVDAAYDPCYTDNAGNMTQDEKGYKYTYDYENRIVAVTRNDNTPVAKFEYDALGRRIRKVDEIDAANTRWLYYNDKWQITAEYGTAATPTVTYVYGNYIDEVLLRLGSGSLQARMIYAHDHLFSPAALVETDGVIYERYEYDAYGAAAIYSSSYAPRSIPSGGNRYLFTGREVDYLDSGNLPLQYNRHRYYSQSLGRWTSEDPLGVDPAGAMNGNAAAVEDQYRDGANLYTYGSDQPAKNTDWAGLWPWSESAPMQACGCLAKQLKKDVLLTDRRQRTKPDPANRMRHKVGGPSDFGHEWLVCGEQSWGYQSSGVDSPESYESDDRKYWKFDDVIVFAIEKKTFGLILNGPARFRLCACASCDDITACISAFAKEATAYGEKVPGFQCRAFVDVALGSCCLKKSGVIERGGRGPVWSPYLHPYHHPM